MKKTKKIPLVSIIIPVFNGASFLEEAVESVQKSTFRDFEVLLIDDGSTDHSKNVCHDFEKKYKNVKFYSFDKNQGLGRVLNFALDKAQGTYICRLNQDDVMLPHRLETQVAYMQKHPKVVACGSWINLFFENGKRQILKFLPTDKEIRKMWHIVSPFSDPSVMYRKEYAKKAGGYMQEYWPADDTHLWIRMGLLGKLANIQKPLVDVRWHKKAASVRHFRKLAWSTYWMHRYTHKYVDPAPLHLHIYWLLQLFAGLTLSPELNWGIYRTMKRAIAYASYIKHNKTAHRSISFARRLLAA